MTPTPESEETRPALFELPHYTQLVMTPKGYQPKCVACGWRGPDGMSNEAAQGAAMAHDDTARFFARKWNQ